MPGDKFLVGYLQNRENRQREHFQCKLKNNCFHTFMTNRLSGSLASFAFIQSCVIGKFNFYEIPVIAFSNRPYDFKRIIVWGQENRTTSKKDEKIVNIKYNHLRAFPDFQISVLQHNQGTIECTLRIKQWVDRCSLCSWTASVIYNLSPEIEFWMVM